MKKDFWEHVLDFFGSGTFTGTAGDNAPLLIKDTSAAGTPTYVYANPSSSGELAVSMDVTNEVQNVCVFQNDILQFDIDKITEAEFRVKMNQASLNAASSLAFGLASARNDAIDSIAEAALFRVIASTSPTLVVVDTDDNVLDNNQIATGKTLVNAYKDFKISFAAGTNDVRFFIDGEPVATATKFDMSNYTGSLQLFAQLQKTAAAAADGFTIDRISIRGRR